MSVRSGLGYTTRSKRNMYVRWRVLIGLGTIFWLLLCLTDDLRERRTNEEAAADFASFPADHFFEEESGKIFPVIEREETPSSPAPLDGYEPYDLLKVAFWNVVAFLSTLCACFTLKCISTRMSLAVGETSPPEAKASGSSRDVVVRRYSSSRIPIPVVSKSSSIDIHIDTSDLTEASPDSDAGNRSCPNLVGVQLFDIDAQSKEDAKTKKIWSIRIMERHCARLREEMINLQATSLKEHASITKRMDALTREKRDLTRQLSFAAKENRSLKQQVDDVLEERTLLIRRLECATKEIRANTKSKRATMAKLDETMANAETFKANLEQIARDKVILEDKLMILDADYKRLKEELALYKHRESALPRKREPEGAPPNREHAIDVYEVSDDNRTIASKEAGDMDEEKSARLTNTSAAAAAAAARHDGTIAPTEESDFDISRSEKDIKKVQQKLITLERSLENFKMRDGAKACCGLQQEKCDLWPVNENDHAPFPSSRSQSRSRLHQAVAAPPGGRDDAAVAAAAAAKPSRSASSQSVCSDEQCPLEHRECADPECRGSGGPRHLHHRGRRARDASAHSICTEPGCALEHRECANAECFLRRRAASAAAAAARDREAASSSDTSLYRMFAREQARDAAAAPFQMAAAALCQRPVRYLRTTVSDDRLSAISEKVTSAGDDSGDEFEPKRKIFTNTPEFQKLLKEILDPQRQSSDEAVRETDDSELVY